MLTFAGAEALSNCVSGRGSQHSQESSHDTEEWLKRSECGSFLYYTNVCTFIVKCSDKRYGNWWEGWAYCSVLFKLLFFLSTIMHKNGHATWSVITCFVDVFDYHFPLKFKYLLLCIFLITYMNIGHYPDWGWFVVPPPPPPMRVFLTLIAVNV